MFNHVEINLCLATACDSMKKIYALSTYNLIYCILLSIGKYNLFVLSVKGAERNTSFMNVSFINQSFITKTLYGRCSIKIDHLSKKSTTF